MYKYLIIFILFFLGEILSIYAELAIAQRPNPTISYIIKGN